MSKIVEGIAKDLKSIPEKLKAKTGNVDKKETFPYESPLCACRVFLRQNCVAVAGIAGAGRFRKGDGGHGGDGGLIFQPVTKFPPKRFADRDRVWHCTPACGVFQSQECQEIPAWHGVRLCEVGCILSTVRTHIWTQRRITP